MYVLLSGASQLPRVEAVMGYVPVDYGFEFNGKHSDFAQQYYLRYIAKDEVAQLTGVSHGDLPDSLQKELKTYALSWDELPGLLQRALLWDAGYALTSDMSILSIYTRNERSMAEIFVPRKAYERTGCTPRACSLPNGEVFYRHKWCDGDQMARVSLCALDGARVKIHAGMWGDGGEVDTIPEVRATRHEWPDHGNTYLMYALHTIAEEVVYEKCPKTPAMVIPCVAYSAQADKSQWGAPKRGKVVEAWLKKYSEDHQENRTWLLVPLTIVVFTLLGVITIYRYKAAVRDVIPDVDDEELFLKDGFFDTGSVEAFLMSPRSNADDGGGDDDDEHPEGDLNAAAFEYFDASIGLSASAFDPMMASFNRIHPLRSRSIFKVHSSKRNEVAIRSFRLFESHRKIRQKRVPFREIQVQKLLSQGATGEVWLATLKSRQVAVKQLRPEKRRKLKEMEMFMAEIYLLAQLKHDNIVSLVGIAWNTLEHIVMVQELMELGDLQHFLAQQLRRKPEHDSSRELFTWDSQRLKIAQAVASALAYMHNLTPKLLHRDVKSRNVLLSADMDVKLCDFGISRRKYNMDEDDLNLTATAAAGTMSWTPPELLLGEDYSEKVDIYSYGVLLTELDTCQLPYHDPQSLELRLVQFPLRLMKMILNEGYRPKLSPNCPPHIAQLIASCLERDPEKRPTAHAIRAMLASSDDAVLEIA